MKDSSTATTIVAQEHHRRPRSIGGLSNPANISYVKSRLHRSWHILVGNMNAFQICDRLNGIEYKPKNVKIVCKFINGVQVKGHGENHSKNKHKIASAWATLFEGMTFSDILQYINNVWLDPSYHFYLEDV